MHVERVLADVSDRLRELPRGASNVTGVQDIVADLPECVLVADGVGHIVAASRGALRLLGYSLQEIRRCDVSGLTAAEDHHVVEPLWEAFRRERRQTGEYALKSHDARVIPTRYAARANVLGDLSVAVHEPRPDPAREES
jgi:PAS domain S-box-containing protein